MSPEVIGAIGTIIIALFSGFWAFMRYLVKHFLTELKPNSGKSLADKVNKLEQRIDDIYKYLLGDK